MTMTMTMMTTMTTNTHLAASFLHCDRTHGRDRGNATGLAIRTASDGPYRLASAALVPSSESFTRGVNGGDGPFSAPASPPGDSEGISSALA
jgi:hypothetical protein